MIEELVQDITPLRVVGCALVGLVAWHYIALFLENRKITSLGTFAPTKVSWWPWSLDQLYDAISHAMRHENLQFWNNMFANIGNPANPWTVEAKVASRRVIFTADSENIKAILATQFQDYGKGEAFNREWHDFLGDSIFTTDGRKWHDSRQLIRPQFIKDRVSDLDTFETHVRHLLPLLGGDGETVDAADLFFRYTLDAATDFLLGKSVNSLNDTTVDFADAFAEVQRVQSIITRSGPLNWLVPRKSFRAGLKKIDAFIKPYIHKVGTIAPEELEKRNGYTFLHVRDRSLWP